MSKPTILAIVRHGLTTAGGALVAQGIGDEAIVQEAIGVILAVTGLVWSIIEKRLRAQSSSSSSSSSSSDPGL